MTNNIMKARSEAMARILNSITAIEEHTRKLGASTLADPTNWGKVGDLQRLALMLEDAANAY